MAVAGTAAGADPPGPGAGAGAGAGADVDSDDLDLGEDADDAPGPPGASEGRGPGDDRGRGGAGGRAGPDGLPRPAGAEPADGGAEGGSDDDLDGVEVNEDPPWRLVSENDAARIDAAVAEARRRGERPCPALLLGVAREVRRIKGGAGAFQVELTRGVVQVGVREWWFGRGTVTLRWRDQR